MERLLYENETTFEVENEIAPYFTTYVFPFQGDNRLSLSAKGLLAIFLSFGPGWKIYINDILKRSSSGRVILRKAIKELIDAGYLTRYRIKGERGRFVGWRYKVYKMPQNQKKQEPDRPTGKLMSVMPTVSKTDVSDSDGIKYKQADNIYNPNIQQQQNSDVMFELKNFGVTEDGINEIIAIIGDDLTIRKLIAYAKRQKPKMLGPAWLRDVARNPSKRPPPEVMTAQPVYMPLPATIPDEIVDEEPLSAAAEAAFKEYGYGPSAIKAVLSRQS